MAVVEIISSTPRVVEVNSGRKGDRGNDGDGPPTYANRADFVSARAGSNPPGDSQYVIILEDSLNDNAPVAATSLQIEANTGVQGFVEPSQLNAVDAKTLNAAARYNSRALATADIGALSEGQLVFVKFDETNSSKPALYVVDGGSLDLYQIGTGDTQLQAVDDKFDAKFDALPLVVDAFSDLADITYSTAAEGRFVEVSSTGQTYTVAASGATDFQLDYTGASGVKLYIKPTATGAYNAISFGAENTNTDDNATAFQAIADFVSGASPRPEITFPDGIYSYSVSPNWAFSGAKYTFGGEVRFRYTGTGNAVILDGGSSGAGVYNCRFGDGGRPKIECPSTGGHAIYCRAFHLSYVKAQVLGAGSSSAGIKTQWLVTTDIDVRCSVNDEGWYLGAKPNIGFDLDIRGAGEQTSYCNIINPDASGCHIGIQLSGTLGNNIFGGAFQASTLYGMFSSTGASGDKFWGTDFEVNSTANIYCLGGNRIRFNDCDTDDVVIFGASSTNCGLKGGKHASITVEIGARNTILEDLVYNRANAGGSISDLGTGTIRHNCTRGNVFNVTDADVESDSDVYINFHDDFQGDTLAATWSPLAGTAATAPNIGGSVRGGVVSMTTGADAAADFATNGVKLDQGVLHWRADQKSLRFTTRLYLSDITNVVVFVGFTDSALYEMPMVLSSGDVQVNTASNAVGLIYDTAADTDNWHLVGVKNDSSATKQNLGIAPVANTFETFKMYVDNVGAARLFRNGVAIGSKMSDAVSNSTLLTPVIAGFSRTSGSRIFVSDFINVRAQR